MLHHHSNTDIWPSTFSNDAAIKLQSSEAWAYRGIFYYRNGALAPGRATTSNLSLKQERTFRFLLGGHGQRVESQSQIGMVRKRAMRTRLYVLTIVMDVVREWHIRSLHCFVIKARAQITDARPAATILT